jgi:glycine cleavage system H protein
MSTTRYTADHEWVRVERDDMVTIGITHYAQEQLGDIVFVELPDVGKQLARGAEIAVVESVKAASEVYAPAAGEVVAVNEKVVGNPALVNDSPERDAWFLKLKLANRADIDGLMDEDAYKAFLETI